MEQLESRALLAISTFGGDFDSATTYAVLLLDNASSGYLKKNATPSPSMSFADNSQFLGDPLGTGGFTNLGIAELPVVKGTVKPLSTLYVTSGTAQSLTSLFPDLGSTLTYTLPGVATATPIQAGSVQGTVSDGTDFYGVADDGAGGLTFTNVGGGANMPTGGTINYRTGAAVIFWSTPPQGSQLFVNYNVLSTDTDTSGGTLAQGASQTFTLTRPANTVFAPQTAVGTLSSAGNVWDIKGNANGTVSVLLRPVTPPATGTPPPAPPTPNVAFQAVPGSPNDTDVVVTWPGSTSPGAVALDLKFGWYDAKAATVSPALAKTVVYPALPLGNSLDGIVAGTFSATLAAKTAAGTGTISVVAKPGEGIVPLKFSLIGGTTDLPTSGTLDTVSGVITLRWSAAPAQADLFFLNYGTYWEDPSGASPVSFTLAPGLTPQQRFIADLHRVANSTVSVQSPITSSLGSADDLFFGGAGGALSAGQFVVDADSAFLNANVTTTSILAATARKRLEFNRPTSAVSYNISIDPTGTGAAVPGANDPSSQLIVSETGSLAGSVTSPATSAAGNLSLTARHADVAIAGTVNVSNQTWLMQSPGSDRPYSLTTISPTTNAQSGRIIGVTVGITLGNDAGGDVDITTDIDALRMTAATTPQVPVLPYDIRINDVGTATSIDAVPASQNSISISSAGTLQVNSAIQTVGSVSFAAKTLGLSGPIFASRGNVSLQADSIAIANMLSTGGARDVTASAANGDLTNAGLITAGGTVVKSVAFASNRDLSLTGLVAVDGTNTPSAGDLVLVKNQTNASQNGVYVAAAGAWTRATEFDTAGEFVPGMVVFVQRGPERGAWVYDPVGSVLLGTSPLTFAPAAAPRVFQAVDTATTANLASLSGLPTVDGVTVAPGSRVLVKDQTNTAENGIYVVQQPDPVTGVNAWLRAADANNPAELVVGGYVLDANRHVGYTLKNAAVQVGVTPLEFATFAGEAVLADVAAATTSKLAATFNATANTLTATVPAGLVVDGVTISTVGQRVLVQSQIDPRQNGIYKLTTVGAAGTPGTAWVLTRDTDFVTAVAAKTTVFVTAGTVNRSTGWQVVPPGAATTVTPNVDAVSFLPFGGNLSMTASGSVIGTARIRSQATSLSAAGGSISLLTNTGRVTAVAQSNISLDNLGAVELASVRNTAAGSLTLSSSESVTATSVAALGTAAAPGTVAITSTFGDVVARSVTSSRGNISLTSANRDVLISNVGAAANVAAAAGSVAVTAANGEILVDGRLQAIGAGSDLTLSSTLGSVRFTANANASAADQLKIVTPARAPVVDVGAQIAANRLSLTAPASAPDPKLGSYQTLEFNRSDAGNVQIDLRNDPLVASLTLEGVTTLDGAIDIKAAGIVVTGPVTVAGTAKNVALTSNTVLSINAAVTATNDIALDASSGSIGTTAATAGLLTAPGTVDIKAATAATVITEAGALTAALSATNAALTVTESSSIDIKDVVMAAGGTVTATVGSAAKGGLLSIGKIDTKQTGRVILSAFGDIVEDVVDAGVADVIANQATLTSTSGSINLDVDVGTISASATQPNRDVSIRDVGTGTTAGLVLGSITAGGTVTVTVGGNLTQAGSINGKKLSVSASAGDVALVAPGNAVGSIAISNPGRGVTFATSGALKLDAVVGNAVTLSAGGLVSQTTSLVAGTLTVSTTNGAEVRLDNAGNQIGTVSASSTGSPAGNITIVDSDSGLVTGAISGDAVALTVAGPLTQAGPLKASSLSITSTAGGPIAFNNSANDVDSVSIVNAGNDISFTDANAVAIGTFTGRDITINAGGALTQKVGGAITATGVVTVNFTGDKQPITLDGTNDLVRFRIDNGTQPVTLNDINDLVIDAITAGPVTLSVGGILTQTGPIVAPSLTASSTGGAIDLGGANDVGTLSVSNPGRAVTFRDVSGLGISGLNGGAVQLTVGGGLTQSGAITATALRVDASAGDVVLTNTGNAVGSIAGSNPGRGFSLTNTGDLGQSAGIVAGTLAVTNIGGQVLLNAANDVDTVAIDNGNRTVQFRDANGANIGGLTGGATTVSVGGPLTQSGRISASTLTVAGTAGSITLTRDDNAVSGAFAATTPSGNVSFSNASGLVAGRVVAGTVGQFNGNVSLKAVGGNIRLTDDVIALDDSVRLEARNGTISQTAGTIRSASLVWFAQAAPTFNTTATQIGRNLTQPGATLAPIVDNSTGTITIYDNSAMSGDIVISAPNASRVIFAGALVAGSGGKVDLRGINPNAVLEVRGDGDLQGAQILVARSTTTFTWIVSGATAADAGTSLVNAVTRANSAMPKVVTQAATTSRSRSAARPQPTRMSTISAETSTIEVAQPLPVLNVPVTFVTPATITAAGGAVSGSGLRLGSGASGSQIRNIGFQGFAGTGIELNGVQNALVQGVTVSGAATGVSVTGVSTGTRILGSTFRNVQTGLALQSASRLTFGGRRAGEANRIDNASREAVFATGFATGTQLIKTQYVGGSSTVVTRNVRGLKVVK